MTRRRVDRARAATVVDVARLAGVSAQTVSRVINDHPNVATDTRVRVREAVEQLRYRPNVVARAMVNGRSRTLGLITTGSPDYGPTSTVLGLMTAARDARYSVSIATAADTDPHSLRAAVDLVMGQHVEAIAVVASRSPTLAGLAGLDVDVPVVVIESSGKASRPSISIDQYAGARLATEHLIGLGHRHIAHIAGPADAMDATERVRGWRDAMADHGLVARAPLVGDWSPRSGFGCAQRLQGGDVPVTAVFVANDQMALGAVSALRAAGSAVPEDVSIVGFDDIPEAEFLLPSLTTVRQDFAQLGHDVVAAVLALAGGGTAGGVSHRQPELIVRESTRPVDGSRGTTG